MHALGCASYLLLLLSLFLLLFLSKGIFRQLPSKCCYRLNSSHIIQIPDQISINHSLNHSLTHSLTHFYFITYSLGCAASSDSSDILA